MRKFGKRLKKIKLRGDSGPSFGDGILYRDENGDGVDCQIWHLLEMIPTDESSPSDANAERVAKYIGWLRAAQRAADRDEVAALKQIADEVRKCMAVIPSFIPAGGFPSFDAITYPEPMTVEEIKKLLMEDIERKNLTEWFEEAQAIRHTSIEAPELSSLKNQGHGSSLPIGNDESQGASSAVNEAAPDLPAREPEYSQLSASEMIEAMSVIRRGRIQ